MTRRLFAHMLTTLSVLLLSALQGYGQDPARTTRAYITNFGGDGIVSIIDASARTVAGTVKVGASPKRLAVGDVMSE